MQVTQTAAPGSLDDDNEARRARVEELVSTVVMPAREKLLATLSDN